MFKRDIFNIVLTDIVNTLHHDIDYFLFCGTALGMIREGTFISHDHDIDIAVRAENLCHVIQTMEQNTNFMIWNKYPKSATVEQLTEVTYIHKYLLVCVDIFLVVNNNNNINEWYSYGTVCDSEPGKRCTFSVPTIQTIDIKFGDMFIPCANESFLRYHYGEDWRVPKQFSYQKGIKDGHYKSMKK
jgi:hypothetical protein